MQLFITNTTMLQTSELTPLTRMVLTPIKQNYEMPTNTNDMNEINSFHSNSTTGLWREESQAFQDLKQSLKTLQECHDIDDTELEKYPGIETSCSTRKRRPQSPRKKGSNSRKKQRIENSPDYCTKTSEHFQTQREDTTKSHNDVSPSHNSVTTSREVKESVLNKSSSKFSISSDEASENSSTTTEDKSMSDNNNISNYDNVMIWLNHQACGGTVKRKRRITKSQRLAANQRERKRMVHLNTAFESLRQTIPSFPYEKKMSRIQTLRLAMDYIVFMTELLYGHESPITQRMYGRTDSESSDIIVDNTNW